MAGLELQIITVVLWCGWRDEKSIRQKSVHAVPPAVVWRCNGSRTPQRSFWCFRVFEKIASIHLILHFYADFWHRSGLDSSQTK